ncbi:hypothetical protein SDC9_90323 [bioreactor metagenome]|uniref:Uncharacterized protein n=1 Tax=bioreactor metagenome TaxID=1076179 RepID=A0A644ZSB8_9ZZZZ
MDDALGRAGDHPSLPGKQFAGVADMEAIYILLRQYTRQHRSLIEVTGQRQLYQDAMNGVIRVQFIDGGDHLILRGALRKADGF